MSCKKLEGKVALVTGGGRGIGKAIAKRLAGEGAAVAIVDVMLETAQKTSEELKNLGVNSAAYKADVSSFEEAENTVKSVVKDLGSLDILINNAGITKDTLLLRMKEEDWDKVIDINLKGVFNFTKAAIRPLMKSKNGKIVNLASVVGRMGNAGQANYSASKAGIIGFTKTVAKEFAAKNIIANAVAPGYIATEMTGQISDSASEAFISAIPAKRAGKPEDVAGAVYFLCSPDSDYVNGQVINIDGGLNM